MYFLQFLFLFVFLLFQIEAFAYHSQNYKINERTSPESLTENKKEDEKSKKTSEDHFYYLSRTVEDQFYYTHADLLYRILRGSYTVNEVLNFKVLFNRRYLLYRNYFVNDHEEDAQPLRRMVWDDYSGESSYKYEIEQDIVDVNVSVIPRISVHLSHVYPEEIFNYSKENDYWRQFGQVYKSYLLNRYTPEWFFLKKKKIRLQERDLGGVIQVTKAKQRSQRKFLDQEEVGGLGEFFQQMGSFPMDFEEALNLKPFEVFNVNLNTTIGLPVSKGYSSVGISRSLNVGTMMFRYEGDNGPRLLMKRRVYLNRASPNLGVSFYLKNKFLKEDLGVSNNKFKLGYILARALSSPVKKNFPGQPFDLVKTFILTPLRLIIDMDLGLSWNYVQEFGNLFEAFYDFDLQDKSLEDDYKRSLFSLWDSLNVFQDFKKVPDSLKDIRIFEKEAEIASTSHNSSKKLLFFGQSSQSRLISEELAEIKNFSDREENQSYDLNTYLDSFKREHQSLYEKDKRSLWALSDEIVLYSPKNLSEKIYAGSWLHEGRFKSKNLGFLINMDYVFYDPDKSSIPSFLNRAKEVFHLDLSGYFADREKYEDSRFLNFNFEFYIPDTTLIKIRDLPEEQLRKILHEYTIAEQQMYLDQMPVNDRNDGLSKKPYSFFMKHMESSWFQSFHLSVASFATHKSLFFLGVEHRDIATETYLFYLAWKRWAEAEKEKSLTDEEKYNLLNQFRSSTYNKKSFIEILFYVFKTMFQDDENVLSCQFLVESDNVIKTQEKCFDFYKD